MSKSYIVHARLKHPGCYHTGYDFTVIARTRAEAIKRARVLAHNEGHTRQDGALVYRVVGEED